MDPCEVMKSNAPALYSFTEEFWQEWDHREATTVANDVLLRWRSDRKRFPPRAYEARNLVWKWSDPPLWRTFSAAERLAICGFPVTALDEILGSNRGPVEARRNTLVGQGFHLPFTIVLFTIIALEVLGTSPTLRTDVSYGPAELFLRRRVHGTAFQPDAFHSFPGLITARDLVEDIFLQLDCQNFSLASKVAKTILHTALYQLQLYWVDTQLRGLPGFSQGPQWRSQMRRRRTLATQSRQRITGVGKFGMGYLIPPGCGKMEHLRLSALLQSPFNLVSDVDDDTEFVAIGQAILGPYVGTSRRLQEKTLKHLVSALTPIHVWLQTKRTPEVCAVADVKNSAVIAALTTLLRWPDRLQTKCYVEGFRIVGPIKSSCIFKPLSVVEDPVPIYAQEGFYGEQDKADLYTPLRSRPSQHHQKILEATIVEQQRGWLGPFRTANDINKEFGAGMWRFIPRFLLQQRLRDRLIDNAKTGKQNHFTQCPETIFSITLDWLGIALKCLEAVFVERCPECLELPFPEWFDPGISLDDLPDAFKGCPVHPADQRACSVVWYWQCSGEF